MPTYEYQCKKCNYQFEELQSFAEKPLVECPNCHTPNLVRLIGGGGGMIFKGSGFYQTDYKSKTPSGKSSSSSSSRPSNGSKKIENGAGSGSEKSGDGAKSESAKDSKEPAKKTPEKKSEGTSSKKN